MKKLLKKLRMFCLLTFRYRLKSCGQESYIGYSVFIRPNVCSIGYKSFVGPRCWLASEVAIGNFVMLAGRVAIVGGDHAYDKVGVPSIEAGRAVNKPVIVGDDSWIGHGAIVMHGITIGEGAIVAAGAVVTKDIESYSIAAGVPATKIRMRFEPEEIEVHRKALAARRAKLGLKDVTQQDAI